MYNWINFDNNIWPILQDEKAMQYCCFHSLTFSYFLLRKKLFSFCISFWFRTSEMTLDLSDCLFKLYISGVISDLPRDMMKRSIYVITPHAAGDLGVVHSSLGITCPSVLWNRVEQWIWACDTPRYEYMEM